MTGRAKLGEASGGPTARLDHLTVVAPTLASGAAFVEAALGARPGPGRAHPGMATHNLLLALGPEVYLEVIAPDPAAPPLARPRWFGLDALEADAAARLGAWVASTTRVESPDDPELGEVETMRREVHTWKMRVRADGRVPLEGAAPLLIQREPGAHPAGRLPQGAGLRLDRLRIGHPQPARVQALLGQIGLAGETLVHVEHADRCTLAADVLTPLGLRVLGGS